jgi:CheY-like chemotaxis protein
MIKQPSRTVILVVEDELFVRMAAVDDLAADGRTILEADCADEALAIIEAEGQVDLLFTDINMPGKLNGLDLAAIVFERQPGTKLIVTSGAQKLADSELPDHGVFISKPYSTHDLRQLVQSKLA